MLVIGICFVCDAGTCLYLSFIGHTLGLEVGSCIPGVAEARSKAKLCFGRAAGICQYLSFLSSVGLELGFRNPGAVVAKWCLGHAEVWYLLLKHLLGVKVRFQVCSKLPATSAYGVADEWACGCAIASLSLLPNTLKHQHRGRMWCVYEMLR